MSLLADGCDSKGNLAYGDLSSSATMTNKALFDHALLQFIVALGDADAAKGKPVTETGFLK